MSEANKIKEEGPLKKPDESLSLTRKGPEDSVRTYDKRNPLEFKLILRLFGYAGNHKWRRNILFVLVTVRAIQIPLVAWSVGAVINGPIRNGKPEWVWWGALGFLSMSAFTEFTFHFRQKFANQLGELVVADIRKEVFEQLLRMPMAFYDKMQLGRIIARVTGDVDSVRQGVTNVFYVTMVNGGQMLVAAIMMLYYDWVLFLIVGFMGPAIYTINKVFRKKFSIVTRQTRESFSRVTSTMAESVSGIRVTQGFVREEYNATLFDKLVHDHANYNLAMQRTSATFRPLLNLSSQVFIAALLLVGGYRVLHCGQPIDTLIQFFFLAGVFFFPFQHLGMLYEQVLQAMAGAERVFHVLDTEPEWEDSPDAKDIEDLKGDIEFRKVTFGYDPDTPVLFDVDLTAKPGDVIALVGHTGSGKSTITSLLAKFYLPTSGEIFIDGKEVRTITSESLHRRMGIIQQENFLFSGTIMENIRLGKPEATDSQVIDAARKLDCLDLIESLPDGFKTEVGERGGCLSLGQRQLVCFIRAMLADPRIFVLDEATSSVDAMTEARIQKSLEHLMQGRTCFVVAHRLSTIRHADEVLVLNHGRVVERGTHMELLAANGVYTDLYRRFIQIDENPDEEIKVPEEEE